MCRHTPFCFGHRDESLKDIRRHRLGHAFVLAMSRNHRTAAATYSAVGNHFTKNIHRERSSTLQSNSLRIVDLFCGIGGFRFAAEAAAGRLGLATECVFSSDIDRECQKAYAANFGDTPHGDITVVGSNAVPDHDLLLAGFPCQPFSIIGKMRGFDDTRGTLFFDIARIIAAKRPKAFVLENVKLLAGHNGGKTLKRILETLAELGYHVEYRILNALHYGLPQKRERIWIVGHRCQNGKIHWPAGGAKMKPLAEVLERNVAEKYYASDRIRTRRRSVLRPTKEITIWHENKAGHISAYPYSCALRAGASYNYLLVNGERRLTPREMLRLQGFPERFKVACSDSQTRKQAGNSLPVNVAEAVIFGLLTGLGWGTSQGMYPEYVNGREFQLSLLEKRGNYNARTTPKKRR